MRLPRRADGEEAEVASRGEPSLPPPPPPSPPVHAGGAGVNFPGPRRCRQTDGGCVMSLIGGRWRRDQWRGCAMDAILAAF